MTTTDPLASFGTKKTPQTEAIPGRDQVKNNAGGYVFAIEPMAQLRRFLTIGTAGGTFYVGQDELTRENGEMIIALTKSLETHKAIVDEIVEISSEGRAKKQNPTLFALAIACQVGTTEGKQYAREAIYKVVRTGTHLFIFCGYLKQFGGWSRGLRKAVGNWYVKKDADRLAYQLVKYRQREGWTHRDVLRLTHPKVEGPAARAAIDWALRGQDAAASNDIPKIILGHELAMSASSPQSFEHVLSQYHLPWEALPDEAMNMPEVWNQMLDNGVPAGALLRQLPRLTKLGLIDQMGGGRTEAIIEYLTDPETLHKARIHPFSVLVALKTYASGQGRGSEWTPVTKMIDGLDEMYYASFKHVEPTGKRTMNALDVSGSMAANRNPTVGNMTPREISAALAMVTVRTEPNMMTVGFTGGNYGGRYGGFDRKAQYNPGALSVLPISERQRLDDVVRAVSGLPFGNTDCSLPMLWALDKGIEIDTFVIYTDNETWAGGVMHPSQALKEYRRVTGIDSKLVVVSITPTNFSIADPQDPGMLDISGFDSAVPQLISDFSAGKV